MVIVINEQVVDTDETPVFFRFKDQDEIDKIGEYFAKVCQEQVPAHHYLAVSTGPEGSDLSQFNYTASQAAMVFSEGHPYSRELKEESGYGKADT